MKHRKRLAVALLAGGAASVVFYWQSRSQKGNDDLLARHKEAIVLTFSPAPLTDNPWHKYRFPSTPSAQGGGLIQTEGIAADKDPKTGKPLVGTGTYPWNPGSITIDGSENSALETIRRFVGIEPGYKMTQNVPSSVVPHGSVGTVYCQPLKNRITFRYRQRANGGLFHPNGVEELRTGYVDRPTGGTSYIIWVQDAGTEWPETTPLDLARMPN